MARRGFRSNTTLNDAQIKTWNFSGDVKAYVLPGKIEPYALIGVGMLFAETTADDLPASRSDSGVMIRF